MAKKVTASTDIEGDEHKIRSEKVRQDIIIAASQIDEGYQELCQLLYEAWSNAYYIRWGFDNFQDYCSQELGVEYRKARYLIGIAEVISDLKIDWKDVEGVGWTKLRVLIPIFKQDGLVGDWLEIAKGYSVRDLEKLAKDYTTGFDISAKGGDRIVTLSFRLTPEQSEVVMDALEFAKKSISTEDNTLALEQMAYDYVMSSDEAPEKVSLERLVAYAEKHFGVQLVVEGREEIEEMLKEMPNENAVGSV